MMDDNACIVGIDLGTTYCCVAYYRTAENTVEIIKNQLGKRTTPSYVLFSETDTCIGKFAKDRVNFIKENVVYDSKRLIGQNFDSRNVQKNIKIWSFNVIRGANNKPLIRVTTKAGPVNYEPEEISAKLLQYMKQAAEDKLGRVIKDVVITVPAYFNYHQRTATERAGKLAGLNVLRIINEPTAAALAYVHQNQVDRRQNFLIFDLGGGTFDVSIATVESNKSITVRATSGDTYLGGRDFDENLSNFIAEKLEERFHVSVKNDEDTMRRIRARSEKTKIELSQTTRIEYDIVGLIPKRTDFYFEINREDFETINQCFFQQCINIVKDCLSDALMRETDIDKVILCGGSSRIPKLQQMLREFFGEGKLSKGLDPDEAVAYGAAIQAATLKGVIVPRITDITPLSLGTDTIEGRMEFIIPRNSRIPVTNSSSFCTAVDKQSTLHFDIYEGERTLVQHNTKIGSCQLNNLPPRPPGYSVHISFRINDNGVLEVEANTDDGVHASLMIDYEKQDVEAVADVLREAKINETKDNTILGVIEKWAALHTYSTNVKAVCTYDIQNMEFIEKDILRIANDTIEWVNNNEVKCGSKNEEDAILRRQKEIEDVCEPILNKCGYFIQNISPSKFYEFILELQKNT